MKGEVKVKLGGGKRTSQGKNRKTRMGTSSMNKSKAKDLKINSSRDSRKKVGAAKKRYFESEAFISKGRKPGQSRGRCTRKQNRGQG